VQVYDALCYLASTTYMGDVMAKVCPAHPPSVPDTAAERVRFCWSVPDTAGVCPTRRSRGPRAGADGARPASLSQVRGERAAWALATRETDVLSARMIEAPAPPKALSAARPPKELSAARAPRPAPRAPRPAPRAPRPAPPPLPRPAARRPCAGCAQSARRLCAQSARRRRAQTCQQQVSAADYEDGIAGRPRPLRPRPRPAAARRVSSLSGPPRRRAGSGAMNRVVSRQHLTASC